MIEVQITLAFYAVARVVKKAALWLINKRDTLNVVLYKRRQDRNDAALDSIPAKHDAVDKDFDARVKRAADKANAEHDMLRYIEEQLEKRSVENDKAFTDAAEKNLEAWQLLKKLP